MGWVSKLMLGGGRASSRLLHLAGEPVMRSLYTVVLLTLLATSAQDRNSTPPAVARASLVFDHAKDDMLSPSPRANYGGGTEVKVGDLPVLTPRGLVVSDSELDRDESSSSRSTATSLSPQGAALQCSPRIPDPKEFIRREIVPNIADDVLETALAIKYPGTDIPYLGVFQTLALAEVAAQCFLEGKYEDALRTLGSALPAWASGNVFSRAGLGWLSIAVAPFEASWYSLYATAVKGALDYNIKAYFEARRIGATHLQIVSDPRHPDLDFSDEGWLALPGTSRVVGNFRPVPNSTPRQVYEFARLIYEAQENRAGFDKDKKTVLDLFRTAIEQPAGPPRDIEPSPSYPGLPGWLVDAALLPNTPQQLNGLATQPNGKLYVFGDFKEWTRIPSGMLLTALGSARRLDLTFLSAEDYRWRVKLAVRSGEASVDISRETLWLLPRQAAAGASGVAVKEIAGTDPARRTWQIENLRVVLRKTDRLSGLLTLQLANGTVKTLQVHHFQSDSATYAWLGLRQGQSLRVGSALLPRPIAAFRLSSSGPLVLIIGYEGVECTNYRLFLVKDAEVRTKSSGADFTVCTI